MHKRNFVHFFPRLLSHALLLGFILAAAPSSRAFWQPGRALLPNFDKRCPQGSPDGAVSPTQRTAREDLKNAVPEVEVQFDPITGAPRFVSAREKFLSAPAPSAKSVLASPATILPADPHAATRSFLREHSLLFGHGAEVLDQASLKREFVDAHNGLRTAIWEQQVDGVPLFEVLLISHTTARGELVNLSSQFVPAPEEAAEAGTPNRSAVFASPNIPPFRAVAIAAQNLGETTTEAQVALDTGFDQPASGPEQRQFFTAPGLNGSTEAKLVWLPMSKDRLRLCWEVVLTSRTRGEMFRVLVDVQTGEALLRHCLTDYISDVSYRVYTNDSPSPFSPGLSTPASTQPELVLRALVVTPALNTNASPAGWIADGGNETRGNNVDAHTDRDNNNVADLPRPQGSPFRVFDFPIDLASQDPSSYSAAAVVQLFYLCNWMHDKLYDLGFTEAAGNFQSNNFGRGGSGNDAVQADAQDGGGVNNANFSTPSDGSAPRMQMYVFNGPSPDRDGDFDAEVVLHEYTHGLSNRRIGGGVGISSLQPAGMGEGWSDFYALSLLSQSGDDVNGVYAMGGYATYQLSGLTQNYYYGIRRYPYSTDLSKCPLTFKDIDPTQFSSHSGVPRNPVIGTQADEVHNMGQVWCQVLWDARANLINKYGWAVGNRLILLLVTGGMNLAPPNPTFLQARDAIVQADVVDNGGTNVVELWTAFAKRGLGFNATSPGSSTATGVQESYDMPDTLRVKPATGFVSRGPVGGPFDVVSQPYSVTNVSTGSFNWSLINTSVWLSASSTGGGLAPSGTAPVSVSLSPGAASLPMGIYTATVLFSNSVSGLNQSRFFTLLVGQPDYFTQVFDSETNDLAFQTFTFTPDGSASFYSVCHTIASGFPTDPASGIPLNLGDDMYTTLTLSGAYPVSIYGVQRNVFFLGSNGYITLNSGDSGNVESFAAHFSRPRISGLLTDLNPLEGGTVSWQELSDRVAVTFLGVPLYGEPDRTNSFQMELFADGRLRLTYLDLKATGGLAGLSAGTGVPSGFAESDLSALPGCTVVPPTLSASRDGDTLTLSWPVPALGFVLETAPSLLAPVWSPVTDTPVIIGDQQTVALGMSAPQALYRLRKTIP